MMSLPEEPFTRQQGGNRTTSRPGTEIRPLSTGTARNNEVCYNVIEGL